MGDAFAELSLGGEMLGEMDGIAIAGELRKPDDIGRSNGLRKGLGHADREVFEMKDAQFEDHRDQE